jgi:hypothetical protein
MTSQKRTLDSSDKFKTANRAHGTAWLYMTSVVATVNRSMTTTSDDKLLYKVDFERLRIPLIQFSDVGSLGTKNM